MHAGEGVAVSSAAFTCDHAYPRGKTYSLQLGLVTIPPTTSPGESYVIVRGSPYDAPCEHGGSCAGYDVRLTVLAQAQESPNLSAVPSGP